MGYAAHLKHCLAEVLQKLSFVRLKSIEDEGSTSRPRTTQKVLKNCWSTSTVSIHQTRHCLRDLGAPTELSQKRVKHLLRYLRGAKHYKFTIEPTTTLKANTSNILDLDVDVDADWAGCPTTGIQLQVSTSSFLEQQLNVAAEHKLQYHSVQQNLSSAQFAQELMRHYTSATSYLKQTFAASIHTDCTSKRAKHINHKFLYTEDLIKHDIFRIFQDQHTSQQQLFTKYISKETLHQQGNAT